MKIALKGERKPTKGREGVRQEIIAPRLLGTRHKRVQNELRRYREELKAVAKANTVELVRGSSKSQGGIAGGAGAHEELSEYDPRLAAVFECASEGILLVDLGSKKFVYGNSTISQMLGYAPEEIRTLGIKDIHPKENLAQVRDRLERLAEREIGLTEGIQLKRKDGSIFYADITSYPMKVNGRTYMTGIIRDVTERKQVEEELRKSEARFRAIFDNTSDGIFLLDLKTRKFFMCNATCARMLRHTQEEFSSLDIADIHPREDLPFIYEQIGKFSRGGHGVRSDIRFKRKDGSIFVADLSPAFLTIAGKEYLVISFKDITERKRAEEALRASEQRFRALVETTSDFVWEVDHEGFYTYASPRVKDLLGYDAAEVIGKTPFDLMPPDEAKWMAKLLSDFAKSGKRFAMLEHTHVHKDGRRVVLETSGVPLFDARGNLAGYRGIDRDITKRKGIEEALRETAERLKEAQALGRIGSWEFDVDNRKITWSDQVYRLYERDPGLGPLNAEEEAAYYTPEGVKRLQEYARRALEEGKEFRYDLQAHLPSGKLAHFSATTQPVKDKSGRVVRLFGTVQDITERKHAEESLWEKERAIESSINGIAISDLDGNITYANAACLKLWGYTNKAEVLGRNATDFWCEPEKVARIIKGLQNRKGWFGELTAERKDGSTFEAQVSASRVVDKAGKAISMLAAFVDITSRKKAEENYRSIFKNAVIGIYRSTPQGQFLAVNPTFVRIFGYESPRQIIDMGRGAAEQLYVRREQRRAFQQLMERHGQVDGLSSEACRRDGTKIWIKENARAVRGSKGRVAYYEGFVRDITTEREAEEASKQAARRVIEAQEEERRRVARGLHDSVGQLLSSARFQLAAAGEKMLDHNQKSCPELDHSLGLMEKAVQEIREIVHNLRPTVLDDLGLLAAIHSLCEEFRETTRMTVTFRAIPKQARFAPEIELALFRIVQEALNNIEKHSRATRSSVSIVQKGASLQIKVKDNGTGFSPLAVGKKKGKNSGYGLHSMTEQGTSIGGKTEIRSAIGRGTEVIVRVPLNGSGSCNCEANQQ
jgi:PAS domain S-box-containing protein